jgi:hypothetical protein
MTRPELRAQLGTKLATDDAFDGFCLDYFPKVHRQFSGEMSRCKKENILLQMKSVEAITRALCAAFHGGEDQAIPARSDNEPLPDDAAQKQRHAVIVAVIPSSKGCWAKLEEIVRADCVRSHLSPELTSLLNFLAGVISRPRSTAPALTRRGISRAFRRCGE